MVGGLLKTFSAATISNCPGSVNADTATMLLQWQWNVALLICGDWLFFCCEHVSVWLANQLCNTIVGVILKANTNSKKAATVFLIKRLFNSINYLLNHANIVNNCNKVLHLTFI